MNAYFEFLLSVSLVAGASLVSAQAPPPVPAPDGAPAASAEATPAQPVPDFHAALTPFGTWATLEPYGEVWLPRVPAGWRPYTAGHWVVAEPGGWTWVSDEPWGTTFHYGRWTLDTALGWAWIPGEVWAPAWVAWRQCDGFIGWAPLPPCAGWTLGVGLTFGAADFWFAIGDPWWSFVPIGCLCHPHLREVLLLPGRTLVVLRGSHPIHHGLGVEHGRPVNRPIAVETVERASGRPVPRVDMREVERFEARRAALGAASAVRSSRPPSEPRGGAGPIERRPGMRLPPPGPFSWRGTSAPSYFRPRWLPHRVRQPERLGRP